MVEHVLKRRRNDEFQSRPEYIQLEEILASHPKKEIINLQEITLKQQKTNKSVREDCVCE